MKRLFASALFAAATLSAPCAFAEKIDLSTWTCSKFQSSDKDTIGIVLAWLDGYYQDENAPPVIDTESRQRQENRRVLLGAPDRGADHRDRQAVWKRLKGRAGVGAQGPIRCHDPGRARA
jgi:hypothetical protein